MIFCSKLIRPVLMTFALVSGMTLCAQVRVSPQGGMNRFQDSLLQHHDSLQLALPKDLPVIVSYEFRLNRRGLIREIMLRDQYSLNLKTDRILKDALKSRQWKHLTRKERKSLCTVVFWFKPVNIAADSTGRDSVLISQNDQAHYDDMYILKMWNQEARYPGGEQAFISLIVQQFNFPDECRKKNHEGYVKMRFSIRPDGSIAQILTMEESAGCPAFKKSIEELIKISEPWIPAVKDGVLVTAWRELPVKISAE